MTTLRTVRSWSAYLPCPSCPQAPVVRGIVRARSDGSQDWTGDACYHTQSVRGADR